MNDNHIADERKPVAYEVHWPNGEHELIYASALRMISDLGDFTLTELYAATPASSVADAAGAKSNDYNKGYSAALVHAIDDLKSGNVANIEDAIDYFTRRLATINKIAVRRSVAAAGEIGFAINEFAALQRWFGKNGYESVGVMRRLERSNELLEQILVAAGASERADAEKDAALNTLFEILMQQNIVTGAESYLSLRCVGVPPAQEAFVQAVKRAILAANKEKP